MGGANMMTRVGPSSAEAERADHGAKLTASSPMPCAIITPRRIVRTLNISPAVTQLVQLDTTEHRPLSNATSVTTLSEEVVEELTSETISAVRTPRDMPPTSELGGGTCDGKTAPFCYQAEKSVGFHTAQRTHVDSNFSASSLSARSFASSVSHEFTELFDNESVTTCGYLCNGEGRQSVLSLSRHVNPPAAFTTSRSSLSFFRDSPPRGSDASIVQVAPCHWNSSAAEGVRTRKVVNVRREERIGRGCFGDVFRAVDLDTGHSIAVKEILVAADHSKDVEKQLRALEREIRVMRKLNHKHIISYYSARRDEGKSALLIYMEYVGGGTVAEKLKLNGPFTEDETRNCTRQLLEGLEYLHRQHIVHRDLKGDNLFLTEDGVLKVGDFGTSKELQTTLVTDSVAGTPNFMAPEVIACSGHSCMADIWSVGCCVLEMLTGHPPFWNLDNHMAVMFAVMKGNLEQQVPTHISEDAKDFIKLCARSDPKERPSARQLQQHRWLKDAEGDGAARSHDPSCFSLVSMPSVKECVMKNSGTAPQGASSHTGDAFQGGVEAVVAILSNKPKIGAGKSARLS